MAERNSEVIWDDANQLLFNQPLNERPILTNLQIEQSTLIPIGRKGEGYYVYDFGGIGQIGNLNWEGEGFITFRYKVSDTRTDLDLANYVGSVTEKFEGTELNEDYWTALSSSYIITQNNILAITGQTLDTESTFQENAIVETVDTTEFPAAFEVRMQLIRMQNSSGASVFMGITDGTETIVLRKYYEELKAASVNNNLVNTNLKNQTTVTVIRDNDIVFEDSASKKFTDGIFEGIDFQPIPTQTIDTLINLKRYADIPSITMSPRPFGETAQAIPFRVRSDYNPSQSPIDFQKYIHYDIKRDAGFYRATVPVVHKRIDLYETEIKSSAWDPIKRVWKEADTNNIWRIAVTLPPGIHRYNFLADNLEIPDITNPESYYLDEENIRISIFATQEGYGYNNIPGINIPEGAPFFSEIRLKETRTIEFLYQGRAKQVSLIGTFNDYTAGTHQLEQVGDRNLIRRLADPLFLYTNDAVDYHKIEIILPYRMSIDTIDFKTLVPKSHQQRVKIYLDDIPVSRLDWNLIPGVLDFDRILEGGGTGEVSPIFVLYGYGYGVPVSGYGVQYGYGIGYSVDYGYGYGCETGTGYGYGSGVELVCELDKDARCDFLASITSTFSYWDNNTDTITAAEDNVVRWCLKDGLTRTAQKITFLSRIENAAFKTRRHVFLDFFNAKKQAHTVTDYGFSDSYTLVQETHTTYSTQLQQWTLPIANLSKGFNELTPIAYDLNNNPIFGDPIIVNVEEEKPSVWEVNRSAWASSSAEVIYGVASKLRATPTKVFSAVDDRSLNVEPLPLPEKRFVNLKVFKQVELINLQVTPSILLFVKLHGIQGTYELIFYESFEDASNDINRLGSVEATEYGEQFPSDFTGTPSPTGELNFFLLDKTVKVQGRIVQVTVGNIVAIYDQGGADKIVRVEQVR